MEAKAFVHKINDVMMEIKPSLLQINLEKETITLHIHKTAKKKDNIISNVHTPIDIKPFKLDLTSEFGLAIEKFINSLTDDYVNENQK